MSSTPSPSRPRAPIAGIDRPLSPHLQVWGWTITMASSITHRASGVALYTGAALLTAFLAAAAHSEAAFIAAQRLAISVPGLVILFGYTLAGMYHMLNGIRHLVFDSGHMLSKEKAKQSALAAYAGAAFLTGLIFALGFAVKG